MDKAERQAARARCEAATEGPWEWYKQHKPCRDIDGSVFYDDFSWLGTAGAESWYKAIGILDMGGYEGEEGIFAPNAADEDFIAESRTDLPAALDEIERLEGEVELLKTSPFIAAIADERQRQLDNEGWTPKHDADPYHSAGQLAEAACYYAYPNDAKADALFPRDWADVWAKRERKDRQRQLVVAAALIVAELDRLAALEGGSDA
jgi:hypothetical protein